MNMGKRIVRAAIVGALSGVGMVAAETSHLRGGSSQPAEPVTRDWLKSTLDLPGETRRIPLGKRFESRRPGSDGKVRRAPPILPRRCFKGATFDLPNEMRRVPVVSGGIGSLMVEVKSLLENFGEAGKINFEYLQETVGEFATLADLEKVPVEYFKDESTKKAFLREAKLQAVEEYARLGKYFHSKQNRTGGSVRSMMQNWNGRTDDFRRKVKQLAKHHELDVQEPVESRRLWSDDLALWSDDLASGSKAVLRRRDMASGISESGLLPNNTLRKAPEDCLSLEAGNCPGDSEAGTQCHRESGGFLLPREKLPVATQGMSLEEYCTGRRAIGDEIAVVHVDVDPSTSSHTSR